jgi:N-acetyl-anhydromuramyl-L-alanine amidase AmpD
MGNIIGEGFALEISGQVKKRQEIYGSKDRDPQINTFLNSKTGWVRMGSSVDVLIDARNLGLTDNALAKEYVLFNGVSQFTNSGATREIPNQRSGITTSDTLLHGNFAYGIGGNEQGLVPMPGITAMSTKTETRGSLKTSTIQIKCHNQRQFDIIDTLYLRLGFTMLLEWGNSSYYNNNGTYKPDNEYNLMDEFLGLKGSKSFSYQDYYPQIQKRRLNSNGNYDALLGKVVNFDWTFNKDGSYDITVILRSMGDVIESLKANVLLGDTANKPLAVNLKKLEKAEADLENIKNSQESQSVQQVLVEFFKLAIFGFNKKSIKVAEANYDVIKIKKEIENEEEFIELETAEGRGGVYANKDSSQLGRWIFSNLQTFDVDKKGIDGAFTNGTTTISDSNVYGEKIASFVRQKYKNDVPPHYFVHFGFLLNFVKTYLVPNVDNSESLINIDIDIDENVIILANRQRPTDNRICQVAYKTKSLDSNNVEVTLSYLSESANKYNAFETSIGDNRYGKIMNIYFNVDFILSALTNNTKDGKTTLIDFLTEICNGWNDSTGNYSKLSPSFVEESNTLRIIDENPLPDRNYFLRNQNKPTELTYFNIYGYHNLSTSTPTSGFVSDFSFKTAITPNLATMITVGANSNGQITGEDATGISRMNNGFRDRIKKVITSPGLDSTEANKTSKNSLVEEFKTSTENYNLYLSELGIVDNSTYPIFNPDNVSSFKNAVRTLIQFDQSKKTQLQNEINQNLEQASASTATKNKLQKEVDTNNFNNKYATASTGFLPFSLSLTMDGISGIKIYQKYSVDTDFLPSNYPTSLEFLVSGIENSINGNKWTTKIESIAIPKNPFSPSSTEVFKFKRKTTTPIIAESKDKTITSGFPLKRTSYQAKEVQKTQIMLHYTAGWQKSDNAESTVAFLMTTEEGNGLTYHYIIDGAGNEEQLIQSNYRAFHAGGGSTNQSANSNAVGISLQNIGYGTSPTLASGGKSVTKSSSNDSFTQTKLVKLVNYAGVETSYRGKEYAQEITDAQYNQLLVTFRKVLSENPTIPPFTWSQESFNQLFPPDVKGNKRYSYDRAKPGYYTHNSNNLTKTDALPTPKLLKFFKALSGGDVRSEKEKLADSKIAWTSLTEDINNIFLLKDIFGANSTPLFTPYDNSGNDNEPDAKIEFQRWLSLPSQNERISNLSTIRQIPSKEWGTRTKATDPKSDSVLFNDDLKELLKEMTESFSGTVQFKIFRNKPTPGYNNNIRINSNF